MRERRSLVGFLLLCTLGLSAFAAQSAVANGTTALTCALVVEGRWDDAHCLKTGGKGGYGLIGFGLLPGEPTAVTGSNHNTAKETTESTTAILHSTAAGVGMTVTCAAEHGEGNLTNEEGPPMTVRGTTGWSLTECTLAGVLKEKDSSCKLKSSEITGKASVEAPTEAMALKFTEDEGPFATFTVEGCKILTAANKAYKLTGSLTAIPKGATLETTEASSKGKGVESEKNGLWLNGQAAWLESQTTLTMSTSGPGIVFETYPT